MTIDQLMREALESHSKGQLAQAERLCREILAQTPENPYPIHLLGVIAGQVGKTELAVQLIEKAVSLHPGEGYFQSNLAKFLLDVGRFPEAVAAARRAIQISPRIAEAHYNLGIGLQGVGKPDEAAAAYLKAIEGNPAHAMAYANLSNIHKDRGQIDEALACLRKAVLLNPHIPAAHGNLVYNLLLHPDYDAAQIRAELHAWNVAHAEKFKGFMPPPSNDKNPDRRLRVGYVSPYFCGHVIGFNMLPLFSNHRRDQFEIFCYSGVARPDAETAQFQSLADAWRDTTAVSDDQLAHQIRADRIDILVDLSLHLSANRLLAFARKPAPVQATFAGYPGSTGLEAIDYRLSDPWLDPPGAEMDAQYCERTIRLPHSFWCYSPPSQEPPVNALPASANGFVTFGCLNNFCKVNDGVLRLWAQVLRVVPESRLVLLSHAGSQEQRVLAFLESEGVAAARVRLIHQLPRNDYLREYHRVDIGLDTVPYNGHTTSLDALWMGVPVVTLVGRTVVGRAGYSQLMNLVLPELIAHTPEQFVGIAGALAGDLPRLANLRGTLRPRMQASPLTDAAGFARGVENAYRQMWRTWCAA